MCRISLLLPYTYPKSVTSLILRRVFSVRSDGKEPVFTEMVTNIADLTPQNGYEVQVLSGLENFRGRKISNYFFPEKASNNDLNEAKSSFFQNLPLNAFDTNPKKVSPKNYTRDSNIECDLYFCSDEPIPCINTFLGMSTEQVWKLTDIAYTAPPAGSNWIFVEISQGSKLLAQKIWQLERAAILLPIHDVSYTPSAVIVLLNGEREDTEAAVKNMKIPDTFKISKLPVYVGWTPTRNIHREFRLLRGDLKSIETNVAAQSEQIAVQSDQIAVQSDQIAVQSDKIAAQSDQIAAQSTEFSKRLTEQSDRIRILSSLIFLSSFVSILLNFVK